MLAYGLFCLLMLLPIGVGIRNFAAYLLELGSGARGGNSASGGPADGALAPEFALLMLGVLGFGAYQLLKGALHAALRWKFPVVVTTEGVRAWRVRGPWITPRWIAWSRIAAIRMKHTHRSYALELVARSSGVVKIPVMVLSMVQLDQLLAACRKVAESSQIRMEGLDTWRTPQANLHKMDWIFNLVIVVVTAWVLLLILRYLS